MIRFMHVVAVTRKENDGKMGSVVFAGSKLACRKVKARLYGNGIRTTIWYAPDSAKNWTEAQMPSILHQGPSRTNIYNLPKS